jgi:serine/threonine protein kinase
MSLLKEGQHIGEKYEVERYLGEGAFAEVYRVQHQFFGRQAMKVFKQSGMDIKDVKKLLGEAVLLSRIGHPNIIRVFDADIIKEGGTLLGYFTMEYVPGGTLNQYQGSYPNRILPPGEAVEIIKQVCAGLAVAHSENPPVIHRDIKPANILIGYDGGGLRAKVSDFGLAKKVNPLTLLASARGTLGFKPPEAFNNMDSCTADIWAIGTTLFLLLTDVLPHPALENRDIWESSKYLNKTRPASFYNVQVDEELDKIISQCLAPDSGDRYSNASSLLKELAEWQTGVSNRKGRAEVTLTFSTKRPNDSKRSFDEDKLRGMAQEAIRLSRQPGKLLIAADMLEEVVSKNQALRDRYASQLKLWRMGVIM